MFTEYIKKAVSPYHTVLAAKEMLDAAGFEELKMSGEWTLKKNGSYYVIPFKSAVFAFTVGEKGLRIAAAHTDFPCPHVKPKAELESRGYLRLNTEIYGGPILNTWLDRPLSMAGRVLLKSKNVFAPREKMIDFERPMLTIPNLAIHYNRDVNKGVELSKQNDMLPLIGMTEILEQLGAGSEDTVSKDNYFLKLIADEIGEKPEDILDFDIYIYNYDEPALIGMRKEMLSSPRLDNLTSCYACVSAIIEAAKRKKKAAAPTKIAALFDNEEIGSGTKQGADSALLRQLLNKIYSATKRSEIELENDISEGFLISADVAHALHPAKGEKYDPVNNMRMNEGVTFKLSANQRYSYDAVAVASLQQLCEKHNIRYKKFVNNSDMPGGGTLGPIISSWLPMKTVDIGVPILAMHSARELMGVQDQQALEKLIEVFFEE